MSYQSPEQRKDEFRRYLEKSGAIESLTTVLVGLYEESDRPLESTEYIRRCLTDASGSSRSAADDSADGGNVNSIAVENEKLKKENAKLQEKIKEMTKTIETLKINLKHVRDEAKGSREEIRKLKSKGGSS
jgi:predicted RNase H-like nuclease (RuvC/YqgF family)